MTFNFEHHLANQFYVEIVQACARLPEERRIEQNCGNHRMQKKNNNSMRLPTVESNL